MVTVTVDAKNLNITIESILQKLDDLKPAFEEIQKSFNTFFGEVVFESQGGTIEQRWAGLSLATQRARASRSGHYAKPPKRTDKILIWTGALQEGFKAKISATRMEYYNDVPYYSYHQLGMGHNPKRQMLAVNPAVKEIVQNVMDKHVKL